ncbi:MAG: hypothetical protein IJI26_11270 [Clostridia bacterium]|nr:hypothetical protein [Clostridia bacterium]
MAKKSAVSKGYRKGNNKKPYLSKRDIVVLCVVLIALIAGAIVLFNYDDGGLKTRDGKIVDAGDNWLIVNGAVRSGTRYYKLGEAGEIEGFTRADVPVLGDENLHAFSYTPDDETGGLHSINVAARAAGAQRIAEYYREQLDSAFSPSEIATAQCEAGEYRYFTYTSEYYAEAAADEDAAPAEAGEDADAAPAEASGDETPAEAADADEAHAPNHFEKAINAYIDANDNGSVSVTAVYSVPDADSYPDEETLKAAVEKVLGAITLEKK